jgi:hypothetical protein
MVETSSPTEASKETEVEIYQFRVYLRQISPEIWRRFLIRSDSTLADLHYTMQILFDWSDEHLHQFTIRGKTYGLFQPGGIWHDQSASEVKLSELYLRLKEKFVYEYDFFDHWQHEIRFELTLPLDPKKIYPICTAGAQAPPLEDCGGAWAYLEQKEHYSVVRMFLRMGEIIEDEEARVSDYLPEFRRMLYWLKINELDRQAINRRLKLYTAGDEEWLWPNEIHSEANQKKVKTAHENKSAGNN